MTRRTTAAFGWIERRSPDGRLYLVQWNRKWEAFNLVGGHQEPGETARECVVREIAEELGLVDGRDVSVGEKPLAHIEFTAWSRPLGEWTAYDMTAFAAAIRHPAAFERIEENHDNRWISAEEMRRGETADSRVVSEVATRFAAPLVSADRA